MAVTSSAVIGYFRTASGEESPWTAYVAPALGFGGLVTAIYLSLHNFDTLTGVTSGPVTYLPWLIPIAALIGLAVWWAKREQPSADVTRGLDEVEVREGVPGTAHDGFVVGAAGGGGRDRVATGPRTR
jgi:hypothetical protein